MKRIQFQCLGKYIIAKEEGECKRTLNDSKLRSQIVQRSNKVKSSH